MSPHIKNAFYLLFLFVLWFRGLIEWIDALISSCLLTSLRHLFTLMKFSLFRSWNHFIIICLITFGIVLSHRILVLQFSWFCIFHLMIICVFHPNESNNIEIFVNDFTNVSTCPVCQNICQVLSSQELLGAKNFGVRYIPCVS